MKAREYLWNMNFLSEAHYHPTQDNQQQIHYVLILLNYLNFASATVVLLVLEFLTRKSSPNQNPKGEKNILALRILQ